MAAHPMFGCDLDQRWLYLGTGLKSIRATGRELATNRKAVNVGNGSRNRRQPRGPLAVDPGQRREETLRVGVSRVVEQVTMRASGQKPVSM